jgi:hypothetical protein
MSPEQAQSRAVDERTDIWSTGVMLYEMVTGAMPFGGPTASHTLVQIIEKDPAPLTKTAAAQVPGELQRIITKAMAKDAEDRYQTAKDMLIDLRSLRKALDAGTRTTHETDRGTDKRRVLILALVAMVIVTAAIFGFNLWRRSRVQTYTIPITTTSGPAVPSRTLTYWMTLQKFREGKYQTPVTVAGELNFEPGDRVRLNVRSPQPGHLYILSEGPRKGSAAPEFVFLFPSSTANKGSSLLAAEKAVELPERSWWKFDKEQGVERLWLIFAEEAVPELEDLKGFASTKTSGLVTDPAKNKSVQDLITAHSKTKPDAERGDEVTTVKSSDKVLVYPVRLEHH